MNKNTRININAELSGQRLGYFYSTQRCQYTIGCDDDSGEDDKNDDDDMIMMTL